MSAVIAVVDDDPGMLDFLLLVLRKAGYTVSGYPSPGRFFDGILKKAPDVCIIDIQLPGMDGREVIRVLRANPETQSAVLIAISASATRPSDVVQGMDMGADEYMAKPLDIDLLMVRLEGLLARGRGPAAAPPRASAGRASRSSPMSTASASRARTSR